MKEVFFNGEVLSFKDEKVYDTLVIENGKILDVCNNYSGEYDKKYDLEGKFVLPAFIDAHSHILATANSILQCDLTGVVEKEEIRKKIEGLSGDILRCTNLSNLVMLDKEFLDSFKKPLVISHNSGHSGFFNKMAQEIVGIEDYFLEESYLLENMKKLPMPSLDEIVEAFEKVQNIYIENGISLAQEGVLIKELIPIYKELIKREKIKIDIVYYKEIDVEEVLERENLIEGGFKIFLDGSPQARTAWLTKPYEKSNEYGTSTMTDEEVERAIKKAIKEKKQIIAHCNGDKAIDQYLRCIERNLEITKYRPVIIHAQLMRKDQIQKAKELGVIPSFFLAHIYYYGDIHIKNLGERANLISPLKTAIDEGLFPTIHQDTPVIMPKMIESFLIALKRETKNGVVLGKEEIPKRIDVLKALCYNSSRQYFMEKERGSLEKGKRADFIILSENLLEISLDEVEKVKVEKVFVKGKRLF